MKRLLIVVDYQCDFVDREPSLSNKRQLTLLATELLCIKEDCYKEITSELAKEKWHKLFTGANGHYVYIIYDDAFIEEALFWKDMEFYHSNTDGWLYIVSMNHQLVFPMNDYGYDLIHDLMTGKDISVMGRDNLPDYADYEWNEE